MFWACAQIEPFRERLALHCLGLNGFEVYCPRLRQQVRSRGRKIVRTLPLFPGYLFVWVVRGWWDARWSAGVRRLVMDGEQPAHVPNVVISEIRSRERNGLVELPKPRGLLIAPRWTGRIDKHLADETPRRRGYAAARRSQLGGQSPARHSH